MSQSGDYWKERFRQLEEAQNNTSASKAQEIQEQLEKAQAAINGKINAWYQRFATNNGISMAEARRMLSAQELKEFQWNVNDYIKYGKENAVNHAWEKQLENASARIHISRLEALKLEVQQELEKAYGNYLDSIDQHIKDVYTSGFYHTAYAIQKGVGIGSNLQKLDSNVVGKIISKPWAVDGKNFSDRIWENKTKLINQVHDSLSRMCIIGESPDRAIREIAKSMNVSRSQAGRLVMTESAAFASKAREDCMKNLGVEEFEVVETLDHITCEYCQSMDGKHFPMKDFRIGVTAPPFHPNCRGCTCPYFNDEFTANEKRAARGEDGKTYYVPSDMTYGEWKKSFVDGDKSGLQEINFGEVDQNTIAEFTALRKQYNEQVQKLNELEKQSDEMLDAYMDAIETPQAAALEQAFNEKYNEVECFRQAVKDMNATLLEKEAEVVKQVEKNLSVKSGIPIDKIKMTGLQYDTANMIYRSYETVLNRYPELKGQLAAFKYDGVQGNVYAGCAGLTGEVTAHGIFSNFDNIVKAYAADVEIGFHPIGTDHNSIIVHEIGHALDGYMTKQRMFCGIVNQYGAIRSSSEVQKQVLERLGWDFEYVKLLFTQ